MTLSNRFKNCVARDMVNGEWPDHQFYRFDAGRIDQYMDILTAGGYADILKDRFWGDRCEPGWREAFAANADLAFRCIFKLWENCHGWDAIRMRRPGYWVSPRDWRNSLDAVLTARHGAHRTVTDGELMAGYIHFLNMMFRASDGYIRSCIGFGRIRVPSSWDTVLSYAHCYAIEQMGDR